MAQKTWKIGECARGGIITAETTKTTATVIGKEWDNSAGYSRNSSQVNAKEFTRLTVNITDSNARRELDNKLHDLTTSYHAGNIMKWIESKVEIKPYW